MSSQLVAQLTFLAVGLSVRASPVQEGSSPYLVEVTRRGLSHHDESMNATVSNITTMGPGLFNPTDATKELKSVMAKYANASDVFAGINIQPDSHPEAGYPRFEPPRPQPVQNSVGKEAGEVTANAQGQSENVMDSDIIGVAPVSTGPEPITVQMPLRDYISESLDVLYYGNMTFGSRGGQSLSIDIDTGSADLWIPVHCVGCQHTGYNSRASSSFNDTADKCKITYGTGKVSGTLAVDEVAVGAASVKRQTFCAAHKLSEDLNAEPNEGLLGLAFGSIAVSRKPTFFENLLLEKQLAASIFSIHLTRRKENGSEVCFGCFDPTKAIGPVSWNPVVSRTYWSIAMSGLSVNSTPTPPTNLTAAVDTGTSLIYLPDNIASEFYSLIPGAAPAVQYGGGFYTFPCDTALSVSLILSNQLYAIHPSDFNLGRTDETSNDCVGGIIALDDGFPPNLAIIGDEFLKSWYSVFDYAGRVGFALSINNR